MLLEIEIARTVSVTGSDTEKQIATATATQLPACTSDL
jgi:hypothetical protein